MRIKKALLPLLIFAVLAACLSGCGGAKTLNLTKLAQALDSGNVFDDTLGPEDKSVALSLFGLQSGDAADCVLSCSTGASVEEYALFQASDETAAQKIVQAVQDRIRMQRGLCESYAPTEVSKLDGAIVRQSGVYVVYVCAADAAAAQKIVNKYL